MKRTIPFLLILIFAVFLRWLDLGEESIWYDESISLHMANQPAGLVLCGKIHDTSNPPLYYYLLNRWVDLLGSKSEASARSLSALFGVLGIIGLYILANRWFDKKIALLTSLLLAVSPAHILLSQEARSYSMVIFLTILSFYFLRQIDRSPNFRNCLAYILSTLALIYTHYNGFFALLVQFVYINFFTNEPLNKRIKRNWIFLLIGVLYLPWVSVLIDQMSLPIDRGKETWYFHALAYPYYQIVGRTLVWKESGTFAFAASELVVLIVIFIPLLKGVNSTLKRQSLATLWLIGIFLSVILVSLCITPLFKTRYLSLTLPAFLLILSTGLVNMFQSKRLFSLIIICALTTLTSLSLFNMYTDKQKEDWRSACAYYKDHRSVDEAVIVYPGYARKTVRYYCNTLETIYPLLYPSSDDHLRYHPGGRIMDTDISTYQEIWLFAMESAVERNINFHTALNALFPQYKEYRFTKLRLIHYWR